MSHTLAQSMRFELEVRKSRFLVQAAPSATPEAALAFVNSAADYSASHNCWATRVGQHYRFSDDGEPAGTAGRPILAAIDGQGLDQVAVVVTRWFGGIKLGAGGLIRAYGGSAAECLRQATRKALVVTCECELRCGFEHLGVVHGLLTQYAAEKLDESYAAQGLRLRIRLPMQAEAGLAESLRDATRGQASLEKHPA